MFYLTGDTHGDFARVFQFIKNNPEVKREDVMAVLGDAGLNYFGDYRYELKKEPLSKRALNDFLYPRQPRNAPREHWRVQGNTVARRRGLSRNAIPESSVCQGR